MNRKPPVDVRRRLAKEVGFGCPVEDCGSPYLEWHHFDPPWRVREHHDPDGMIALCRTHHIQADAGAFTNEDLRQMKRLGRDRNQLLGAKFNWMREELVVRVGGSFFWGAMLPIQFNDIPLVWFNRDEEGRLLVNLQTVTRTHQARMVMTNNFWMTDGTEETEIVCPPSGRLISAKYPADELIRVEFRQIDSVDEFDQRFPLPKQLPDPSYRKTIKNLGIQLPFVLVEIDLRCMAGYVDISPTGIRFGAEPGSGIIGGWFDCMEFPNGPVIVLSIDGIEVASSPDAPAASEQGPRPRGPA